MTAYDPERAAAIVARLDELVMAQPCGYCNAEPWQRCRTKWKRRAAFTHSAREAAIWEAYRLGAEHAKMD